MWQTEVNWHFHFEKLLSLGLDNDIQKFTEGNGTYRFQVQSFFMCFTNEKLKWVCENSLQILPWVRWGWLIFFCSWQLLHLYSSKWCLQHSQSVHITFAGIIVGNNTHLKSCTNHWTSFNRLWRCSALEHVKSNCYMQARSRYLLSFFLFLYWS